MDRFIHQNYPAEQRAQILRDSADFTEEDGKFTRTLSENELTIQREQLAEVSIQISELDDEKKEATKLFKNQLDPLKKQKADHLTKIKTKQETVNGPLHGFKDHEAGQVFFYDDNGEMVHSRRLRANETQKTVMAALREAK